jgi:hypothetical protein
VGLTEIDTSSPWYIEERKFDYHYEATYHNKRIKRVLPIEIKLVKDSDRSLNRIGTIVKLNSSFRKPYFNDWQEWFLTKRDKNKKKRRIPWRPLYCSEQYAIIANCYKRVKDKGWHTFSDYGKIVILLTGSKIGRVKKLYMQSPYDRICSFDEIPNLTRLKKPFRSSKKNVFLEDLCINDLASTIIQELGTGREARVKFVNILYENLVRLGYVK